jgi:hypothetical protein
MLPEISQEDKQRLWLTDRKNCMHSAINTEFLSLYTGEIEKKKVKNLDPHFDCPAKFTDVFCALPEVKEKGMSATDTIGIRDILSLFLFHCSEAIKRGQEYAGLAENPVWLEEFL